jgi:hypothetical protein
MVKSIIINDHIHEIIRKKQYELKDLGIKYGISEMVETLILDCIEEFVQRKKSKKSNSN